MTIPTTREELLAMLARRMMAFDQCAEPALIGVYLARADDVLSALDEAGIALVPKEATKEMADVGKREADDQMDSDWDSGPEPQQLRLSPQRRPGRDL